MAHQQQPPPSTAGGEPASSERRRLLLLGGTGFVGSEICRQAAARGWSCVVLSRRGGAEGSAEQARLPCQHVAGDATQPGVLERTVAEHGPFDALVHCVGALLDGASGLRYANLLVSASRSLPAADQSYADLTEGTALELLRVARVASADGSKDGLGGRTPFVFISAAEAGWADEGAPMPGGSFVESWSPQWLRRYLAAKRSVEGAILSPSAAQDVRGVVLRPSFVWNWWKVDVLLPVAIFTLLSALGVPFVDRPVRVETIAAAAVAAIDGRGEGGGGMVQGVLRQPGMDRLALAAQLQQGQTKEP
jgi:nucleoside-diphosphate-sugar epimerase